MDARRAVLAAGAALVGVLCACGSSAGGPPGADAAATPESPAATTERTAQSASTTSTTTTAAAGPRRYPAGPPPPMSTFPKTISDDAILEALPAAVASAGGCTVMASVGAARITLTYVPRPQLVLSFVGEAWGSGTLTSGSRKARVIGHWLATTDGSVWLDDGTSAGGKAWVEVPETLLGLRDVEAVRAHPLLSLVSMMRAMTPDHAGQGLAMTTGGTARLVGTQTIDGQVTGHYTWTTPGGRREDVWLGRDWLPRRHLIPTDVGATAVTVTVDYRRWGSAPPVQAPPQAQVTVAPAVVPPPA